MWEKFRHIAISILIALLAALSTYYTTIGSLKLELAGKAEEKFVSNLDKRLSNLEVRLADNFATKKDFYQLREDLIVRLSRIEIHLNRKETGNENR
jgi:hypothetical protein